MNLPFLNTLPPVQELLGSLDYLKVRDEQSFSLHKPSQLDCVITDSVFAQYHPNFAASLRARFRWNEIAQKHNYALSKTAIISTFELLNHGYRNILTMDGNLRSYTSIINLTECEPYQDHMFLRGSPADLGFEKQADGTSVPFIMFSDYGATMVPKAYLGNKYPGWEKRYAIAKELGIENKELVDMVLPYNDNYKPSVLMDNVSF